LPLIEEFESELARIQPAEILVTEDTQLYINEKYTIKHLPPGILDTKAQLPLYANNLALKI